MSEKKIRGRPFEKGNKLGTGAPRLPDELRTLMKITGEQGKRDICEVYNMNIVDLQSSENRSDLSAGRRMIMSCMNNAIQTGDNKIMATFLDRLIGKPKEVVEIEMDDNQITSTKDHLIGEFVSMLFEREKK